MIVDQAHYYLSLWQVRSERFLCVGADRSGGRTAVSRTGAGLLSARYIQTWRKSRKMENLLKLR